MKHSIVSRFALVGAFLAALLCVGLATTDAEAQRLPGYGRQGSYQRGGYGRDVRQVIRQEILRREAMRSAPARWGRADRSPAPRWAPAPRGRHSRGRW